MAASSLGPGAADDLLARAAALDAAHAGAYPDEAEGSPPAAAARQPVHTVYVPADRFGPTTVGDYGHEAARLLDAHAPDGPALAAALGLDLDDGQAESLRDRVAAKLRSEPVEDLRIDFEDGYGARPDDAEDSDAVAAAAVVDTAGPPNRWGVRVKPWCDGAAGRSLRTLDLFLTRVLEGRRGVLPPGFAVTLPKVLGPGYVASLAEALGRLEAALGLAERVLVVEIQVETTQSIIDRDGRLAPRALVDAADGRCVGAHFGTFDYTAALGLAPREQRITHPACDFARHLVQVALAGSGVRLSDGSTNAVPASEATADVHAAWRQHAGAVRHSLASGYFQGWDLHPSQLVSRFGATFAYLLADIDGVLARLAAWRAGEPGPAGALDEPATARALERQVRLAVACGALPARQAGRALR